MKEVNTTPGKYQVVRSENGCTVTQTMDNGQRIEDNVPAGESTAVFAFTSKIEVDDDSAVVREVFSGALIAGGNGGGGVSATGEKVVPLAGDTLEVQHATWFENASQGSIAVQPASWRNEVMTCYLKTAVPVELAGVRWLYGQPTLVAGYTYVVALQQIGADVVLANLAYTIPQ